MTDTVSTVTSDAALLLGRREAVGRFLASFVLVAMAREARAAAPPRGGSARRWIDGQQQIAEALAAGQITGLHWALEVERLGREIDPAELMALVRRSELVATGAPNHNDPQKRFVRFLDDEGRPRRLAYGAALFAFAPHNVITPHGHKHMVSAHMVVAGSLRVRNFDRVADEEEAMVIRPTRDYVARVGDVSTMCSERDNIHWFVPRNGPATTFDVVMSGLDAGAPDHVIQTIDPRSARRTKDGALVAPLIGFAESARRYTAAW